MYEFHPYFTTDGSVGLYNTDFNDIYHSADGALTEAYEKFILPIDFTTLMQKKEIKVLDICYGIGYNSKSFLNYIFENYFSKNSKKNLSHAESNIASIYTNNNFTYYKEKDASIKPSCNDTIYTDNIFPKISITAIDNDKILSFLSPFIKTGVKNFRNDNLDFKYKNIDKYLIKQSKTTTRKINEIINFLILENIVNNSPEIFENDEISLILNNSEYSSYFDKKLTGIFEFYKISAGKFTPNNKIYTFLHNIYYRHISECYKNRLKTYKIQDVDFNIKNMDARQAIIEDTNKYNLIFLDAFTPSKCPCLWSYEFFVELFKHLNDDGMILTYSTSASIRGAMLEAGFYIGNIYNERQNKFTGTIATKDKSKIKFELSEYDLGLIKTRAGIFYRDRNLTAQNEAIIEERNLELKNSSRMSSSKYQKLYKEVQCSMM